MFTIESLQNPSLLTFQNNECTYYSGPLSSLERFSEFEAFAQSHQKPIVFVTPFSVAGELGYAVRGCEPILAIEANVRQSVSLFEIDSMVDGLDFSSELRLKPTVSDSDFSDLVRQVQHEEIAGGNACQVVLSRAFEGQLKAMNPQVALALFRRLVDQPGSYLTFLFSDGSGNFLVGASPERHLEVKGDTVIKNPIAGTLPKNKKEHFHDDLVGFLNDPKECNELSQILDEELKIMARICPDGGKITGPFLRESGAVIHTEYHLTGHSNRASLESLKQSFHAPTLVGSPLKSAFHIIAERELTSRRYYGGEIGILEPNGDLTCAILIRTAELFSDGRVVVRAGAGITRDSIPEKEAIETTMKAAGVTQALLGESILFERFLTDGVVEKLNPILSERNQFFSDFHFEDQIEHVARYHDQPLSITIVDNEDRFSDVLKHMAAHLGYHAKVVDAFDFSVEADRSDLVILGPGPGDINDDSDDRMVQLRFITRSLLDQKRPVLGVCLGMQALALELGIPVQKQAVPTQGLQKMIDYFGKEERVGFYNSFSPLNQNVPTHFEVSSQDDRLVAFRNSAIFGIQFHVESAMTENGLKLLNDAITFLLPQKNHVSDSLESFVRRSISGEMTTNDQVQFLTALNERGYTGNDLAKLAQLFYEQNPQSLSFPNAVDVCGTGGSGLPRINTSTISAFVLAACNVPVAKHGNKAASGRFGSFDLLESMGLNLDLNSDQVQSIYSDHQLAFLYARSFHPVFKHFAEARKRVGTKTIFNLLGPLLNPSKPNVQLIGVSDPNDMQLMIDACKALNKKQVAVVCGMDGLDEITLTGSTKVMELKSGDIKSYELNPSDFGFESVPFEKISGGNPDFNLSIAESVLNNTCANAHLNLVLANVAFVLKMVGRASSLKEGVQMARGVLNSGKVEQLKNSVIQKSAMPTILQKITADKRVEIEQLKNERPVDQFFDQLTISNCDFKAALSRPHSVNLIAEIKKASPSAGTIYNGELDVSAIAKRYESMGAAAISVLTDAAHFRGSYDDLKTARASVPSIPLLMKDFVIDEYQIYLARSLGADAILLIASILDNATIDFFISIAESFGMNALVEVHNKYELERVLKTKASIIGINNRNLHTFEIDTNTFLTLYDSIPRDKVIVAESGYSLETMSSVVGKANAVLMGTALMKGHDSQIKLCGIRSVEQAKEAERLGVDYVGLNFVLTSKRCVDLALAQSIRSCLNKTKVVGVFQNQSIGEVNRIAHLLNLDFLQLSGDETPDYCKRITKPIFKTLAFDQLDLADDYRQFVELFIIDSRRPGSGESYDYSKLKSFHLPKPFLIAGGINPQNARSVLNQVPQAIGIDLASGIETNGSVDITKMTLITHAL